ncbi:MAG: hypothetical protein C5B52_08820 [Bacteroidetes bacterium]|nr:MAG: hypothetical protein C5B52_08820 [Bacteroidota bacterium]
MHRLILLICVCSRSFLSFTQTKEWPVLKHYEGNNIYKIAMPVGGIGTGAISIGGNGQWKDVEIMNKPGIGFYGAQSPKEAPCFMIYVEDNSGKKITRTLMGPISPADYTGQQGSEEPNHGLPRFSEASFDAAYPFATVSLKDYKLPLTAKLRVFNPFIPGNADASGIPVAVIRYEISNPGNQPLTISVAGSMNNFIGMDGSVVEISGFDRSLIPQGAKNNRNTFKQTNDLAGIFMSSDSVDHDAGAWGTMALATSEINKGYTISYRTEFDPKGWNENITDMWDDFSDDGVFKDTTFQSKVNSPRSALAIKCKLAPGETKSFQFLLGWRFPNRKDWEDKVTVGNYYATKYQDGWDVLEKTLPQLNNLENKTVEFVNLLLQSDYPQIAKEAALFNTSTLRSQTTFRTSDGYFFGWEGVFASTGSCFGNCTHVWNYEQTTAFLFGELARKMREVEYNYALVDQTGLMAFRVSLPLKKNTSWVAAAADGQMGTVMKVYREWQLSGDNDFLKAIWPGVKKALSFAWIPGGWDADKDGVMEGCQHNTMDIEYYGPNPEIEFWYLGALKAASRMATFLKDNDFAKTCTELYNSGSKWTDEHLFNGEFYIQKIQPAADKSAIATGLLVGMGSKDFNNPDFQIGEGCLVDQLVGQNMALITGLGYLTKSENVRKALKSIYKYNYVQNFGEHFNNMRSYALGNESGLMLTAYPDPSKRPRVPLSYAFEAWTGLEYTAAAGMIYAGMEGEAIQTVTNVRNRYDGFKRNPFNEEECGNHYARAMASWSTLLAWSKFNYSAVDKKISFTSRPGNYFWSNGYSWGSAVVKSGSIQISVHYGSLNLSTIELKDYGELNLKEAVTLKEGDSKLFSILHK